MQESQREVGIVLNEQKHMWEGLSKKSANTTLIISTLTTVFIKPIRISGLNSKFRTNFDITLSYVIVKSSCSKHSPSLVYSFSTRPMYKRLPGLNEPKCILSNL